MEIWSRHSEMSVISQVSTFEGCSLSGVPLYMQYFCQYSILPCLGRNYYWVGTKSWAANWIADMQSHDITEVLIREFYMGILLHGLECPSHFLFIKPSIFSCSDGVMTMQLQPPILKIQHLLCTNLICNLSIQSLTDSLIPRLHNLYSMQHRNAGNGPGGEAN